jgi:hypothetical protein
MMMMMMENNLPTGSFKIWHGSSLSSHDSVPSDIPAVLCEGTTVWWLYSTICCVRIRHQYDELQYLLWMQGMILVYFNKISGFDLLRKVRHMDGIKDGRVPGNAVI